MVPSNISHSLYFIEIINFQDSLLRLNQAAADEARKSFSTAERQNLSAFNSYISQLYYVKWSSQTSQNEVSKSHKQLSFGYIYK